MIRVFKHWVRGATLTRVLIDFAFVFVGAAIAFAWVGSGLPISMSSIALYVLFLALVTLTLNTWLGIYQRKRDRSLYDSVARALISLYVATPIAYGLFALFPVAVIDRNFLELSIIVGIYGMLANRVREMHWSPQNSKIRVLIFGCGESALDVKKNLEHSDPDVEIVGFYCSHGEARACVAEDRVVGKDKSLLEAAKALKVDEIIVAVLERRGGVMPLKDLLDCRLLGVNVIDLATHFERRLGQIRLDSLRAGWLIFGEGFDITPARRMMKFLVDMLSAVVLLALALPVMLLTAVLIVIEDGFPIFYRQERVGRQGRLFDVIKFRSMRRDAEKDGKPRFAMSNDDRTTKVGRVIRKFRIDELPQLFCVLKGDMSMVGPRPERPYFVDQLCAQLPFYSVRHSVKPGVTGWAQVKYQYGGSIEDSAEKLQYDLYYVKNHSLFLDSIIMFETVNVVLTGKGAC